MSALLGLVVFPALAHAERLSEMYVPTSGRIEVMVALGVRIEGLQIRTFDDVIALRDKLSEGPLDEASLTSWKFLDRVGLKKRDPSPPPPLPPGAVLVKRHDIDAWQTGTLNFQGELIELSTTTPGTDRACRTVIGPRSCVRIQRHQNDETFNHTWHFASLDERLSPLGLFSRAEHIFRYYGEVRPYAGHELFVETFIGREVLLVDRKEDAILAYAQCRDVEQLRGISQFTIHLQLKSTATPQPHQIPMLTLRCHGSRCDFFYIKQAEFDVEIPPESFVVDVPAGTTYTALGSGQPIRSGKVSLDITAKSPLDVVKQRKGN
ncbi:hypothetical protein Enr8_36580 [Blastopirellula retiformator]|uniref:Uncharacterized protein n=1 Tax=Blastopirellula retiformator TaxID=2527970 RepID=A0A5C5UZE7_9BACT|nr:hypothetical protein Enr8_36580 [Blastopirellula retiformator]